MKANPKLSQTSKMPGKSWSLPAWSTCPGARDAKNEPVEACSRCYALTGAYVWPQAKALREHNLKDWKAANWVEAMTAKLYGVEYFRWFDSGDIYTRELARKIHRVMAATPSTKHWLPTRSHKVPEIYYWTRRMDMLPNVAVRYSSDSTTGERLPHNLNSTILQAKADFVPEKGYSLCRASERKGKCGSCRACWSKQVTTIAYIAHGNKVNPKQFNAPLEV